MYELFCLIAEGEAVPNPQQQPAANMASMMIPFILIFFVMYFLVIRPGNRQRKEQMEMITRLEKNDKVLTSSGILGFIVSIKDSDEEVVIKTGDHDTRITILKSTIVRNFKGQDAAAVKA